MAQYTGLPGSQPQHKSMRCMLATQHCLLLPATYRDRGREEARLDNEAASLPVFILSRINTPERNTLLFFVRKRTCAPSFGAV